MDLVDRVLEGDRRAVARAISMVEDGAEGLEELSAGLFGHTGRAHSIGLTGSPGVGKSTLAGELVGLLRGSGRTVAVLAIDPTSPLTGGALLGDRVRMQEHATDPGVFIRSMATRGHLGGMALAAPEAVRILDAAGSDVVIVETVGVGQAEVDVAAATDTTLVVVAPGWGDAIQVAKAGILEIADLFVVNKADRDGADAAARDLESMIRLGAGTGTGAGAGDGAGDGAGGGDGGWSPPVVVAAAATGVGVEDVWAAIERHRAYLDGGDRLVEARSRRLALEVASLATERLRGAVEGALHADAALRDDLAERRLDPYRAAAMLLERVGGGGPGA